MFQLNQSADYLWPVSVRLPEDNGVWDTQTFKGRFFRLSAKRVDEIRADIESGKATDIGVAREVLVGWEDVTDGEDPVPFSAGARDRLLDVPGVATAVVLSWVEALRGQKRKN